MDAQRFQTPPNAYREAPFWSWNDDLDPEELKRQIKLMDEAGWGGFFMHARVGLRTPYLGRAWMACVRACVDEARARGMGAWLYDEDKWPSGFAGGLSVAPHPDHRAQCLVCKVDNRPALLTERIATFAAREEEGRLTDVRPDEAPKFTDDADRVIQFYPLTMPLGTVWFNDYAYLDLLNPEAVRAFVASTHEAYAELVGADFGETVPGVFTDEPQYWRSLEQPTIPWTESFPALFRKQNGYDLLPRLPALFFDVGGDFHAVRYDYWRTITKRFVEAYTRQVYVWCEEHGVAYTGHYNAEDSLLSQIRSIGAAMPHYPAMHVPGVDKLGRQINTGPGTVLTIKQLDSVVCQTGKPRALCENYGCGGQDFAHTGRKWIGDWAYVLGITLNNPHLSLYSMRGERKRDYPQNLFYQQPWWPENRLIADYFARLSYALSQGQRVVDILVIHPIGSAWTLYRPGASYEVDRLDQALDDLLMALMQAQRDVHLGDEMLMEPGAACEARATTDEAGAQLTVGRMAYRAVILPPGVTLAENTVRLLHEFAQAGGPVLALKPVPELVDGRPVAEPLLPETTQIVELEELLEALDELLPFDVRVPGRHNVWAHHRRIEVDGGDADLYFLANVDRDVGGVATVQLRSEGYVETWDPATGEVDPLPSRQRDGITEVVLDFPPAGSHLLMLHPERPPAETKPAVRPVRAEIELDGDWDLELGGPNALTLDTAKVRVGSEEAWSEPMHVLDAHGEIADAGTGTPFALCFAFDTSIRPSDPVHLVVESPESFEITVNGRPVSSDDVGWWTDISFRKLNVSEALRAGENEVVLRGRFGRGMELESLYLVGDFGVSARRLGNENHCNGQVFDRYEPAFRLTDPPTRVRTPHKTGAPSVDLTARGLPFFTGRVRLRQTMTLPSPDGQATLEIQGLCAAVAHVAVNGEPMGAIAWPPHQLDVTQGLRPGPNEIEIELVGTLRNLLGPHHRAGGDREWTGPGDFRDQSRWTDDYILTPFGFDRVTLTIA
jgi:hypothetical protein